MGLDKRHLTSERAPILSWQLSPKADQSLKFSPAGLPAQGFLRKLPPFVTVLSSPKSTSVPTPWTTEDWLARYRLRTVQASEGQQCGAYLHCARWEQQLTVV
jgi:hypothetical protein